MLRARVEEHIAQDAWSGYQHQFAGNATRAERAAADLDFDSPLMRLAAGGRGTRDADQESFIVTSREENG
jgi:FMN reductase